MTSEYRQSCFVKDKRGNTPPGKGSLTEHGTLQITPEISSHIMNKYRKEKTYKISENFHSIGGNNILNNRDVLIYASNPNKQLPNR